MNRFATVLTALALLLALVGANLCFTRRAVLPTVGTDSPMLSAALVAMGGSRGIVSEVLWWRIADLQRQNRYAELVPLTDLLVALDPASADTWVYNAWNLTYNISAAHHDDVEKWRWVKRGIELLERGLRATPRAEPILRQLGWTFEDKVAGSSDTSAAYYRAHLMELPLPADAAAFAARLGCSPDWRNPRIRALYWYDRANHAQDTLRTLMALFAEGVPEAMVSYLVVTVRQAWNDLAVRQQTQVYGFLQQLYAAHPQLDELATLLQEVAL